jgi:TatD DNase family protein
MPFIDIHTHHSPDDAGSLFIKNIFPSDVALNLQPGGFYSVGLHPWHIGNNHNHKDQLLELEQKVALPEVIAVGECGLDKLANTESQLQLKIFIRHSELAEKTNKPLVIHCVKAYNEISHLKRKMKPKVPWILHGYSGNEFVTRQLLLLDFYFSLGKIIFNEKAQVRDVFPLIPADHVFFETDEWNQPVDRIYMEFARLSGMSLEKLSDQVMWNFRQVFLRQ